MKRSGLVMLLVSALSALLICWTLSAHAFLSSGSLRKNPGGTSGENFYDIALFFSGVPANSQNILLFTFVRGVNCPEDMSGSYAAAGAAATDDTSLIVKQNGTTIGTIAFSASGSTGTFTGFGTPSFAVGDVLAVIAPAEADVSLGDLYVTLACTPSS